MLKMTWPSIAQMTERSQRPRERRAASAPGPSVRPMTVGAPQSPESRVQREKVKDDKTVLIRIEQLYPFPVKHLGKELKKYKDAKFFWCQEEPMNMGGWNTARYYIDRTLEIIRVKGEKVNYIGRNAAASPATGNLNKHLAEQKEILEKVFDRKK